MIDVILLALACLAAPLLAKSAGYEIHKKPFDLVGIGGLFFLLGAAFIVGPGKIDFMAEIAKTGSTISYVIGWLLVIVGAFRGTVDVIMEKEEPVRV